MFGSKCVAAVTGYCDAVKDGGNWEGVMCSGRWLLALAPSLSERQHEPAKDIWEGREVSLGRKLA